MACDTVHTNLHFISFSLSFCIITNEYFCSFLPEYKSYYWMPFNGLQPGLRNKWSWNSCYCIDAINGKKK